MILIEAQRSAKGWRKSDLARAAKIQAGVIGWIEEGRFKPYESQLQKIAEALEWDDDLDRLLNEVEQ
jgi:ribosome-binding protein aMBF1 (putative translation factor)